MKLEKREKSPQGNVLKENQKKQKSPHKVIYGAPSKLVKILKYVRTKTSLVGPVVKLNCLNDTKTSFLGPFKLFIFYKKILHALKALKAIKALKA